MAANEAEIRIVLRAIGTELLAGMQQMQQTVEQSTERVRQQFRSTEHEVTQSVGSIRERVTVGFSGIQGSIRAFGTVAEIALAILGLERAISGIVGASQEWAKENEHLHAALDLNFHDVAALAIAAKEADAPIEQLDLLIRGLGLHLNSSEQEFRNVGVAVRDTGNAYLPLISILENALHAIDTYRAGTDQLVIAQRLFGRGATAETIEGLRKTIANLEHAREVARDFGLVVGQDGVVAAQALTRAEADLGFAFLGVKNIVADALRPEIQRVIGYITQLAREGTLQAWARDTAEQIRGVSNDIITLAQLLRDHAEFLKAAAVAWSIYKGALFLTTAGGAALGTLTKLREAIVAIQAAQIAAATTNFLTGISEAALAANAGTIAVANLAAGVTAAAEASVVTSTQIATMGTAITAAAASVGPLTAEATAAAHAVEALGIAEGVVASEKAAVFAAGVEAAALGADRLAIGITAAAGAVGPLAPEAAAAAIALEELAAGEGAVTATLLGEEAAAAGVTGTLGTLEAAAIAAGEALGPFGIAALLLSAGAAFITYEGWWKEVGDAIEHTRNLLRGYSDEQDRLRQINIHADEALRAARQQGSNEVTLRRIEENRRAAISAVTPTPKEVFGADLEGLATQRGGTVESEFHPSPGDLLGPGVAGGRKAGLTAEELLAAEKKEFEALRLEEATAVEGLEKNELAKLAVVQLYSERIRALIGVTASEAATILAHPAEAIRAAAESKDPAKIARTEQILTQQKTEIEQIRKVEEERRAIGELGTKARESRELETLTVERSVAEQSKKLGLTTEEEKLRTFIDIEDRRLSVIRAAREAELRLLVPDEARLADIRTRLTTATTPEEQQVILAGVDARKFIATLDAIETATRASHDRIAAIEFEINERKLERQAEEIRSVFDQAFGDLTSAAQRFSEALIQGNEGAAGQIASLRVEVQQASADFRYAAATTSHFSDEFVKARERMTDAQNQLNSAVSKQSVFEQAAAAASREFYSQALSQAVSFLIDIVKLQALRVAAEIFHNAKILDEDKITGEKRIALLAGDELVKGGKGILGFLGLGSLFGGGAAEKESPFGRLPAGEGVLAPKPGEPTTFFPTPTGPAELAAGAGVTTSPLGLAGLTAPVATPAAGGLPGVGFPIPLPVVIVGGGPTPGAGILGAPTGEAAPGFVGPPAPTGYGGGGGGSEGAPSTGSAPSFTAAAEGGLNDATKIYGQIENVAAQSQQKQTALVQGGEAIRLALLVRSLGVQLAHLVTHTVQSIARVISGETAKTGATIVGGTAEVAAAEGTLAGKEAVHVQEAALDAKSILGAAAKAAARVYSYWAETVPYIGPIIGAALAAVTFGAVAAYTAFISAEEGGEIGANPALLLAHPRELVFPAARVAQLDQISAAVREGGSGAPTSTGGSAGGDLPGSGLRFFQTGYSSAPQAVRIAATDRPVEVEARASAPVSARMQGGNIGGIDQPVTTMDDGRPKHSIVDNTVSVDIIGGLFKKPGGMDVGGLGGGGGFAEGGEVPHDMEAKVHGGEFVFTAGEVKAIKARTGAPDMRAAVAGMEKGSAGSTSPQPMGSFQEGGEVPKDMQARVHAEEFVFTAAESRALKARTGAPDVRAAIRALESGRDGRDLYSGVETRVALRAPATPRLTDAGTGSAIDTAVARERERATTPSDDRPVINITGPIAQVHALDGADARSVYERTSKDLVEIMSRHMGARPSPRRFP